MKLSILYILIFTFTECITAQIASIPYAEYIEMTKKSVLPIICIESNGDKVIASQGTGTFLGQKNISFYLTCEHVIALKDSTRKTIALFKNIFAKLDTKDSSSILLTLKVDTTDEALDVALLSIDNTKRNAKQISQLSAQIIQKSYWHTENNLNEGDQVLYIGYPVVKKLEIKNYPISRIGIISQNIRERPFLLVDGFVQHGHSGAPVFVIREKNRNLPVSWEYKLIGISTSFPNEFGKVFEPVSFRETDKIVIQNPGFTNVTKMSAIIKLIQATYSIK